MALVGVEGDAFRAGVGVGGECPGWAGGGRGRRGTT